MLTKKAQFDDNMSVCYAKSAKAEYDNACNRFENANDDAKVVLAISEMNAAMKRICFIVRQEKENADNCSM